MSKALVDNETSHENFRQLSTKKEISKIERKYQNDDAEKVNLIEEGKKIGINEVIKRNEIINNNLK